MSQHVHILDAFKPLPVYSVTPIETVAMAMKMGRDRWDHCRSKAFARALGEYAVVGDCALRVEVVPPPDSRPPEGWLHEFCPEKAIKRAQRAVA